MYVPRQDLRTLIDTRSTHYIKNKPKLILSHWDKDHYHCLLGMQDVELSAFSCFIFRDFVPNLTSRKLYSRISSLISSGNLYAIPAEDRTSRGGFTSLIPLNDTKNQIVIYNSQYHKNRNISGILLTLKTAKSSIVLSGDALYSQISRCILPHLNYNHKHNLIVPHHSGKGGEYIYNNPGKLKFETAIISVGKNNYGHPNSNYVKSLKTDFNSVLKTSKEKKDIKIDL